MSYLDYTRKDAGHAYETTMCITKEECKVLLPFFKNAHKKVKQKLIDTRTFMKVEKQRKDRKICE